MRIQVLLITSHVQCMLMMLPMGDDKSAFVMYHRSKSILAEGFANICHKFQMSV